MLIWYIKSKKNYIITEILIYLNIQTSLIYKQLSIITVNLMIVPKCPHCCMHTKTPISILAFKRRLLENNIKYSSSKQRKQK